MGTRADFYVGRGEQAEWLGSIGWDGYPEGMPSELLTAATESDFRGVLAGFLEREDGTLPAVHGWPWPWETSYLTDWVYAFDGGQVWAESFDREWFPASQVVPEDYSEQESVGHEWPLRGGKPQGEIFGPRSGVIVFGEK